MPGIPSYILTDHERLRLLTGTIVPRRSAGRVNRAIVRPNDRLTRCDGRALVDRCGALAARTRRTHLRSGRIRARLHRHRGRRGRAAGVVEHRQTDLVHHACVEVQRLGDVQRLAGIAVEQEENIIIICCM